MDCAVRKLNPHKRTINEKLIKKKQKNRTDVWIGIFFSLDFFFIGTILFCLELLEKVTFDFLFCASRSTETTSSQRSNKLKTINDNPGFEEISHG